MKRAIFPGTFDPFTIGHYSIVMRGLNLFDEIIIGIGVNQSKNTLFDMDNRVNMIRQAFKNEPRVSIETYDSLTIDFADAMGAKYILRGLRTVSDFEYEFQMAGMNRQLMPDVETLFLTPADQYQFISGTFVREIAMLGGDVSKFVVPLVMERLQAKVAQRRAAAN